MLRDLFAAFLLLCLACFVPSAAAAEGFEQAMLRGDYEQAVVIAERIVARAPRSAVAAYNAGCACSRAGHADRAIEWLMTSARLGFSGVRSIADDDDLDPVRGHAGFGAVRQAVEANVEARFAAFRAEAERARPTVILPPGHDPAVAAPLLVVRHGTGGTGAAIACALTVAALLWEHAGPIQDETYALLLDRIHRGCTADMVAIWTAQGLVLWCSRTALEYGIGPGPDGLGVQVASATQAEVCGLVRAIRPAVAYHALVLGPDGLARMLLVHRARFDGTELRSVVTRAFRAAELADRMLTLTGA